MAVLLPISLYETDPEYAVSLRASCIGSVIESYFDDLSRAPSRQILRPDTASP